MLMQYRFVKPRGSMILLMLLTMVLGMNVVTGAPQRENGPVAPEEWDVRTSVINDQWVMIVLNDIAPVAPAVDTVSSYQVDGLTVAAVERRHWPERAPYTERSFVSSIDAYHVLVTYRIYLQFTESIVPGKEYTINVSSGVGIPEQIKFSYAPIKPTPVIHVNQACYPTDGPKVAYLSCWTGQSTIDFSAYSDFELIDAATGELVYTGSVTNQGYDSSWSYSNVYAMDFSAFTTEGEYRLRVPGVGASYRFGIWADAGNRIGYTVTRGLTMLRDGDHGLTEDVTYWHRPPAHLDDALDEETGERIDLVGGHMDAGDRGRYPWNSADLACSMLVAMELFPDEIKALGESLELPESGNGVPDFVDECVYELEWLNKALSNSKQDHALSRYLRPVNENGSSGYEMFQPLEGKPNRQFYSATHGPNRHDTLYAIGALAMAAANPMIQEYLPMKSIAWQATAEAAFAGFMRHHGDDSYWMEDMGYDVYTAGPNTWSDEMLVAAANLFILTGESQYFGWVLSELPADMKTVRRWSWDNEGTWIPAWVTLARSDSFDAQTRQAANDALLYYADQTNAESAPFGMPLLHNVRTNVGWYFSGSQIAYPNMVAYGLSGDSKYRDKVVQTWNWLLGTNPLSRTFFTGMGQPERRPRWTVLEIGQLQWAKWVNTGGLDGWPEVPPGIPSADIQNDSYPWYFSDEWNLRRKDEKYPAVSSYPPLYRYKDGWVINDEFTINNISRSAASLVPLFTAAP